MATQVLVTQPGGARGAGQSFGKWLRRNRNFALGISIVVLLAVVCSIWPLISSTHPNTVEPANRLSPMSADHIMGTDQYGRDVFARFLHGGRISLLVGLTCAAGATVFGLIFGILAGYVKWLDQLLMRIADGLLAIPGVLLGIGLMASLGPKVENVIIAMTVVSTPTMARLVRSRVISVKEETYIEAIKLQRPNGLRLVGLHIVPNILTTVVVQATFIFADTVIAEASLSFLGAGVPAPEASWGNMLSDGKTLLFSAWWVAVFPAIGLIVAVIGLNLAGDGLRDMLDPKMSTKRR